MCVYACVNIPPCTRRCMWLRPINTTSLFDVPLEALWCNPQLLKPEPRNPNTQPQILNPKPSILITAPKPSTLNFKP